MLFIVVSPPYLDNHQTKSHRQLTICIYLSMSIRPNKVITVTTFVDKVIEITVSLQGNPNICCP